jgi:hypothetical protein
MKLTSIVLSLGLSMALGPWIFIENPPKFWLWISITGLVFASVSGYNAQARMIGLGEPGEDLLQSWWRSIKKWLRNKA